MAAKTGRVTGIVAGVVGVVAVMGIAYGLLRPHDTARPPAAPQNEGAPAPTLPVTSAPMTPAPGVKPGYDKPAPLTLLGTVLAGQQENVSVRQPARIVSVSVAEGQAVRRGQLLVLLDMPEARSAQQSAAASVRAARSQVNKATAGRRAQIVKAEADIQTAYAGVTQASERLKQAQLGVQAAQAGDRADLARANEGVRKAQLGLKTAQRTLDSLEQLSKVGGVSRNELEGARTQVTSAHSDLDTANAAVQQIQSGPNTPNSSVPRGSNAGSDSQVVTFRVANARQEAELAQAAVRQAKSGLYAAQQARKQIIAVADADIQSAQASVQQAEAGLSGAQSGGQAARLTASLDGIASNVTARVGETAQPGQPLLTVVSFADARIEALVLARQLAQIQVGQNGQARLDARPDAPLAIVVSRISRVAEPDGRTFRVTFRLLSPPSTLRVGQMARITLQ